jgi:hypothetical protein
MGTPDELELHTKRRHGDQSYDFHVICDLCGRRLRDTTICKHKRTIHGVKGKTGPAANTRSSNSSTSNNGNSSNSSESVSSVSRVNSSSSSTVSVSPVSSVSGIVESLTQEQTQTPAVHEEVAIVGTQQENFTLLTISTHHRLVDIDRIVELIDIKEWLKKKKI